MKFRVIPIVLYDGTTVVKGANFRNDRTIGAVEAIANLFSRRSPDEIFFIDISATYYRRDPNFVIFEKFAEKFDIPFCVGGGIHSLELAQRCLRSGAEKVLLGTAACQRPELITEIAQSLGSQAVVASVDVSETSASIFMENGKVESHWKMSEYLKMVEKLGAGEILFQNISRDGTRIGLNIPLIKEVLGHTTIPVIVSGGVGNIEHFLEAAIAGASGAAAGSIFQFTETTPMQVARHLHDKGIDVRMPWSGGKFL